MTKPQTKIGAVPESPPVVCSVWIVTWYDPRCAGKTDGIQGVFAAEADAIRERDAYNGRQRAIYEVQQWTVIIRVR